MTTEEAWTARQTEVAEILRTHQYDEGVDGQYPGRCFCGNAMGDQEEHQAAALIQCGLVPIDNQQRKETRS